MITGRIFQENHNTVKDKLTIMIANYQFGNIEVSYKDVTINTSINSYKIVKSKAKFLEIGTKSFDIINISGDLCGTISLSNEYDMEITLNQEYRIIHCIGQGDEGTFFPQYTARREQRGVAVHLSLKVMHRDEYSVLALDYPDLFIQILAVALIDQYKYTDAELLPNIQYETETLYPTGMLEITRYDLHGNVEHISCASTFGVRNRNKKKYEMFNPNWTVERT